MDRRKTAKENYLCEGKDGECGSVSGPSRPPQRREGHQRTALAYLTILKALKVSSTLRAFYFCSECSAIRVCAAAKSLHRRDLGRPSSTVSSHSFLRCLIDLHRSACCQQSPPCKRY